MDKTVVIDKAANGLIWVHTHSRFVAWKIGFLLRFRYGFRRKGKRTSPVFDEGVYPDFVKDKLRIQSGWDIWMGFDFIAGNPGSDKFLREFSQRHLNHAARTLT